MDVPVVVNPLVAEVVTMLALAVLVLVQEDVRADVKELANQVVKQAVNPNVLIPVILLALIAVEILVLAYVVKDVILLVYQAAVEHVIPVVTTCVLLDVVDLVHLIALPHVQQHVQEHHIALTD